MKKIAFLLGSLNRGGTETLLLDVFRNAKKNELDAIGVYRKSGVLEQEFIESGVNMHKLVFGKNLIIYLFQLRKLLKVNKINVVHAQQPIDALYAWLAVMGTGIKIILTLHGYDFNNNKFGNIILSFIIQRTDQNIYVSASQKDYYQHKFRLKPNKQQVVYNGISFDKFDIPITSGDIQNKNLREELKLSPDILLLGTVGNFVTVRDQITLCRFLKRLHDKKVHFHFVFIGKSDEKNSYLYDDCVNFCEQNGLNKVVSFLGSRTDVPGILTQLNAFLYSTDHDTFGIAVVEAMAVGIPVFVNDWGVMKEITDDGRYATLYKTKDDGDLLQHFLLFLHEKMFYLNKAKIGASFVRTKFSIEKHIEHLKRVYRSR